MAKLNQAALWRHEVVLYPINGNPRSAVVIDPFHAPWHITDKDGSLRWPFGSPNEEPKVYPLGKFQYFYCDPDDRLNPFERAWEDIQDAG